MASGIGEPSGVERTQVGLLNEALSADLNRSGIFDSDNEADGRCGLSFDSVYIQKHSDYRGTIKYMFSCPPETVGLR